jgi:hypothetical protein
MTTTSKPVRPYKHIRQPTDDNSLRQWLETELANIQRTLNDILTTLKANGLAS